jgi:hypothetical protein
MTEEALTAYLSAEDDIYKMEEEFRAGEDDYTKFLIASRVAELNKKEGAGLLLELLKNSDVPFVKEEIYSKLKNISRKEFDYDVSASDNKEAFEKIERWIKSMR